MATQTELGAKLNPPVSSRMVGEYVRQGMPGIKGNWILEDCQAWVDRNVRHRGERRPRAQESASGGRGSGSLPPGDEILLNEPTSPQLERFRKIRADTAQLDLDEKRKQLIPREQVHELLVMLSGVIRTAGETLQRQFGNDAARILEEALNDADGYIDRFITDAAGAGGKSRDTGDAD